MTDKITNTPKLRFKGYTDTWEQEKLGKVADVFDGTHQTPKYIESGVKFVSVENIRTLETEKCISEEAYENEYSKKQAEKGDVLMTRIGDIGTAKVIETDEPLAYYVTLSLLKPKCVHSDFLAWLIASPEVQRDIWKRTLHIAFPKKINLGEINQVDLKLPALDEQTKIGNFFKQLDSLITLHQRQLALLKIKKQTFLSKMFPKDGTDRPEIRFEGFTYAWEQEKLGEAVTFYNGRAYKQEELLDEGKYRVLRVGNFNTNDRWYWSDLELDENKYAEKGDLLYLWATNFGPEIWNEEKVIYHYHIWKLQIDSKKIDKKYLYTWLITDKERIKQTTNGTTMVHVTKGSMEERLFQFPTLEEQTKIGTFFKHLDSLITLHQRELETLKTMKKTLLNQMFV